MPDYAAILEAIQQDPRYQENLDWGKPRAGHPEGTIRAHIEELERSLRRLRRRVTPEQGAKLRLLIHTHDTFKPQASDVAISDPRSHASLARRFLAEFVDDPDLLAIVQFHDEPYALWRQVKSRGTFTRERLDRLIEAIHDWDLFLAFLIVDGSTVGKSHEPLQWFFAEIDGKIPTSFSADDIL